MTIRVQNKFGNFKECCGPAASWLSRGAAAECSHGRRRLLPHGTVAARCQWSKVPSLAKEGWTRHQENAAKPPLMERTGWFVQRPIIGGFNEPPRLRPIRKLRAIFLRAQPPLLCQGGDSAALLTVRQQPLRPHSAVALVHDRERQPDGVAGARQITPQFANAAMSSSVCACSLVSMKFGIE